MQTKRFGLCAALSATALLLLAGCAGSGSTAAPTLTVESSYPLQYAKQFAVDECTGGYELITIADSQYLVVPQALPFRRICPRAPPCCNSPLRISTWFPPPLWTPSSAWARWTALHFPAPRRMAGTCPKPKPPCRRGRLPMRASTAPRTMKPFWLPAAALPLKTP